MPSPVLGIDLGTTNSVVAVFKDGNTTLLADEQGQQRFPSVVTLGDSNNIWTGNKALAIGAVAPERTIYAVKRLIGRNYSDPVVRRACESYPYPIKENPSDGGIHIQLGDQYYTPEEISGMFLRDLKELAARQFGFSPEEAVVTVPAYFNHSQREATQRAAQKAGLSVLRLLNEPTAAALSLYIGDEKERLIAVYDFGGGTFDISVIRIQGMVYEVLATNGDTFLGGDDIDNLLRDELSQTFEKSSGVKVRNYPLSWHRLRDAAENAKKELSRAQQCSVYLPRLVGDESLIAEVLLSKLEEMVRPLIERSIRICADTIEQAQLKVSDLTEVILVGGQTRMPLMRQKVEEFFGRPASPGVNPDTSVAEGAAREGSMLQQGKGVLLLDVTPITLGINILGNRFYPLIPRNTKIPVRKEHLFTTHRDEQKRARIMIFQGDKPVASENVHLGEVVLSKLRKQERFQAKIKVVFEIDASGILHVKACDADTDEEKEITIRDSFESEGREPARHVPEKESVVPTPASAPPTIAGPFYQTELVDVLYFLHANGKTGRLDVRCEKHAGSMILKTGEITHATFGESRGVEAVKSLLALTEGRYVFFDDLSVDEPVEIETPFDSLIPVKT